MFFQPVTVGRTHGGWHGKRGHTDVVNTSDTLSSVEKASPQKI